MKAKRNENSDTMWPEKIAAIYGQFPWLQNVFSQSHVDRAYVERFDEGVLDIKACSRHKLKGDWRFLDVPEISVYLVDKNGGSVALGQREVDRRRFLFLKYKAVELFDETVRRGIKNLPSASKVDHVVMVQHAKAIDGCCLGINEGLTRLTVFKPPQNEVFLRQWHDEQVALVNKEVAEVVESI